VSVVDLTARYAPYALLRPSRRACAAAGLCAVLVVGPTPTQNAVANGETRTLTLHHAHTRESITVTFRRHGSYDQGALEKLNWFLRDWRRDEPVNMDPRLFDVVWETYRESGSGSPIRVVSAYRSPDTNAMLRRRSSAVAKHSQHMLGKAMDMHYEDVSMAKIREIGMKLQRGGVGYYPTAGTPFVHLDVGSVRSWPRMPRAQLARLFPDGRTVHLPAEGSPLEGYEAALADIQSRGGSAVSYADITGPRRSLWAVLFGGEDGEMEDSAPVRGRGANTRNTRGRVSAQQVAALSTSASGDSASVYAVGGMAAPERQVDITLAAPARPARPQPMDEPAAAPAPKPVAIAALTPPVPPEPGKKSGQFVDAPIPPRRPSDLKDLIQTASVPLPPIRPAMMASASLPTPAPEARSPIEPAPKLALVPLPPARPATPASAAPALAKAALPSALSGGAAPQLPASVSALAPSRAPAVIDQPARPKAPADFTLKLDSSAMNALMADVSARADRPRQPARVDLPSVQQSVDSRVIAGRLGPAAPGTDTGRFAGGLAKPYNAGFVTQGD